MAIQYSIYRVGDLKGDYCRDRIEHTLSHLGGVSEVNVDLDNKEVKVEYDPSKIASGYMEEAMQSLGYSVQG